MAHDPNRRGRRDGTGRGVSAETPRGVPGALTLACLVAATIALLVGVPAAVAQVPLERNARPPTAEAAGEPAGESARAPRLLTLREAIDAALRRSPDLAITEAERDGADADRLAAYGAFLPSLSFDYGYSLSSTGRLDPTGQTITNTSYTGQLTARYDIFSGFRRVADVSASRRRSEAADARHRDRRFRVVLETKTAYFEAVAARELAEVERDRVRRQEAQLDSVRVQLELGQTARTDLLRSEVALNVARLALVRAENAARTADFRLARAIGSPEPVEPSEADVLEPRPLPLDREAATAAALGAGPAVGSARAEAAAARAGVLAEKSAWLPEFSFAGGWAWSDAEFPPTNRSWRIFVFGGIPLFNGFQRENRIWQARARADAAEATARAEELRVREEVQAAYDAVEAARVSIDLAATTVALAREELAATQERFRFGRGSILEMQEAQISLRQAEADVVRARFDYQVGVATLEYLLGTELEGVAGRGSGGASGSRAEIGAGRGFEAAEAAGPP